MWGLHTGVGIKELQIKKDLPALMYRKHVETVYKLHGAPELNTDK